MARKRRQRSGDGSLDLLLDTMCNAFGGIVLIAILVALLIEKPGEDAERSSGTKEDAQLLVRKQKQLEELQPRVEEAESELEKVGEIVELLRERNRLAAAISEKVEEGIQAEREIRDQLAEAREQKDVAESAAVAGAREIASLEERMELLKKQEKELEQQREDLIAERKQEIRPPVLRNTPGRPFNVIFQHGLVYPVQNFERNRSGAISGVSDRSDLIDFRGGVARPIPGKGLSLEEDRSELLGIINGLLAMNRLNADDPSKQIFFSNLVFGDSFAVYREFDTLVRETGAIERGWEPFGEGDVIRFGSGGSKIGIQK